MQRPWRFYNFQALLRQYVSQECLYHPVWHKSDKSMQVWKIFITFLQLHPLDVVIRQMRLIQLASFIGHLFLAPNLGYSHFNSMGEIYVHGDLAVALMIFGLVTFAKVILHPLSFHNEECYPPSYDKLEVLCPRWANQEAACGCEVLTNLYCGHSIIKKSQFGNMLSYM